jgi:hypothetical protein
MDVEETEYDDYLPGPMEIQPEQTTPTSQSSHLNRPQDGSVTGADCLSWTELLRSSFPKEASKKGHVADDEGKQGIYSKRLNVRALPERNDKISTAGYPSKYTEYIRHEITKFTNAPVLTYGQMTSIMKNTLQKITFRKTDEGPCAEDVTDMDRRLRPNKDLPLEDRQPANYKDERWHREATNLTDCLTDSEVMDIMSEIEMYGYACVDTEGKNPPELIQVGSPTGRVLLVRTKDLRGKQVAEVLSNPQIIKFQSDLQADVDQLKQLNLEVNSCVNTQNLWKQWDPECDQVRVGTEATAKRWNIQYSPYKFENHEIEETRWAYEEDGFRPLDLVHAVQDVRIHTYALYGCVQAAAERIYGIKHGDELCQINIYPLIHQVLASWLDLEPKIALVHRNCWDLLTRDKPWTPSYNHPEVSHKPRALKDIQHYFDTARALILVKDYDLPIELRVPEGEDHYKDVQRLARVTERMWREHPLPRKIGPDSDFAICTTCGGHVEGHPEGPCKLGLRCLYPLCKTQNTHSTAVCHSMLFRCQICRRRGHHEEHHKYFDPLTLDYTFLQWAPLNMVTSLVFAEISTNDDIKDQARTNHWRLSLYGRNRCQSQQLVNAYGIKYEWPEVQPIITSKNQRHRANKRKLTESKPTGPFKIAKTLDPVTKSSIPLPPKESVTKIVEPNRLDLVPSI